jgi:type I restriction enzyme S subunit
MNTKLRKVKLGQLFSIKHGFAFKSEWYSSDGDYQLVTLGNFIDKGGFKNDLSKAKFYDGEFPKEYILNKGDLIIALTQQVEGLLGSTAIVPESNRYVLNQRVGLMRCKPSVDTAYINYLMRAQYIREQIERTAQGTKQRNTSPNKLYDVTAWVSEPQEQLQIGTFLSRIDDKIELNSKINAELEAMAKLVYDYWFVQFDFPNEDGKPYKSSGGKMVYNEELKREIPEGWEADKLHAIANVTTGKLDSNAEVENGEYHFYTCSVNPTRTDTYAFDDSVILIAGNNANGNFHVNRYSGKFNAYQRTYVVTAKAEKHLDYLYQVLSRQMKVYKNQGKGSQTKFLTLGMLTDIQVFKVKKGLMEMFCETVGPFYRKQVNIVQENQELASLRDWLLPMLMNGQVKVGEGKELLKAAEDGVGYGKS